jgi:hypothetical protein
LTRTFKPAFLHSGSLQNMQQYLDVTHPLSIE